LAAVVVIAMFVFYATVGQTAFWQQTVTILATIHVACFFTVGLLTGLLACVLGWQHGKPT